MLEDVQAVADFYATRRGRMVARLLRRHLLALWPDLRGQSLLGLGYAAPFLGMWRDQVSSCIDGVTAAGHPIAAAGVPAGSPLDARCALHDDLLPFPDRSLDRVLLVHALENATNAQAMLRAAARALRDDGRLLVIVPNRDGLWARGDGTPFADGAPCSTGRIERMLARSLFRVERMRGALFCPPADLRPLLRIGATLEAAGRFVTPRLAGVLLVEAVKDIHAALPTATVRMPTRRVLMPLRGLQAARGASRTLAAPELDRMG